MDVCIFFFQAEDGIRDLVRSRGLGDVYKRQTLDYLSNPAHYGDPPERAESIVRNCAMPVQHRLYLSLIHI